MHKILCYIIFIVCLTFDVTAKDTERHYCTQFGPFYIRFDEEKAAGVFNIFTNNDMGSIVGKIDGNTVNGEWIEVDSRGDIKLTFSQDWTSFDASYSVGPNNGNWRTGWKGMLRPDNSPASFEHEGVKFLCSRD